jgi:hypothetical protein
MWDNSHKHPCNYRKHSLNILIFRRLHHIFFSCYFFVAFTWLYSPPCSHVLALPCPSLLDLLFALKSVILSPALDSFPSHSPFLHSSSLPCVLSRDRLLSSFALTSLPSSPCPHPPLSNVSSLSTLAHPHLIAMPSPPLDLSFLLSPPCPHYLDLTFLRSPSCPHLLAPTSLLSPPSPHLLALPSCPHLLALPPCPHLLTSCFFPHHVHPRFSSLILLA